MRLAELLAALSLGIDLGFAQPMEHVLRQCLIALRIAERIGLDERERAAVYYTALLVNVGCHTDAHEQAKWFGDDIALKSDKYRFEMRGMRGAVGAMRRIGAGNAPLLRLRTGLEFLWHGHRDLDGMIAQHARLARMLAEQLRLPGEVLEALESSYELWDGRGWPGERSGATIPMPSRIAQLAEFVEVAHRTGGVAAALALASKRSGSQFDPTLVACLRSGPEAVFADLDAIATWQAVVSAEPALAVVLAPDDVDAALRHIADFVDLKSPYTLGHSGAVADLVAAAGEQAGLSEGEVRALRRAALVSGFGRLGVSNAIWDKRGPLGVGEWERMRMYPYITERMLRQSGALASLGRIAVAVRERMDGSGYPQGLTGNAISIPARLLAAAEAYQTKVEPRPHREALAPGEAAEALRAEVRAGRLASDAVEAVLLAAGHSTPRRRDEVGRLTAREVEVLRLVARGLSAREIGERLVISPKTASNHIEHLYDKIGVSNRAAASLFAVQHGFLTVEALPGTVTPKMG